MMKHKNRKTPLPSLAEMSAWVRYDPETGRFYRLSDSSNQYKAGQELTGTVNTRGYVVLNYRGRPTNAARVAFLLMTGAWPEQLIDHINRNKTDNRWVNLRLATTSQNRANNDWPVGVTGFRGVKFHPGNKTNPYFANISVKGRKHHLGFYPTPEEAAEAYQRAARTYFGEFVPKAQCGP